MLGRGAIPGKFDAPKPMGPVLVPGHVGADNEGPVWLLSTPGEPFQPVGELGADDDCPSRGLFHLPLFSSVVVEAGLFTPPAVHFLFGEDPSDFDGRLPFGLLFTPWLELSRVANMIRITISLYFMVT